MKIRLEIYRGCNYGKFLFRAVQYIDHLGKAVEFVSPRPWTQPGLYTWVNDCARYSSDHNQCMTLRNKLSLEKVKACYGCCGDSALAPLTQTLITSKASFTFIGIIWCLCFRKLYCLSNIRSYSKLDDWQMSYTCASMMSTARLWYLRKCKYISNLTSTVYY